MLALLFLFLTQTNLWGEPQKNIKQNQETQSEFLIYYQPLSRLQNNQVSDYIQTIQLYFKNERDPHFNELLTDPNPSPFCTKHHFKSCLHLIYNTKDCIPKKQTPAAFCHSKAKKMTKDDFAEPVFDRINWNRWALKINRFCFTTQNEVCLKLVKLRSQYMDLYNKRNKKNLQDNSENKKSVKSK